MWGHIQVPRVGQEAVEVLRGCPWMSPGCFLDGTGVSPSLAHGLTPKPLPKTHIPEPPGAGAGPWSPPCHRTVPPPGKATAEPPRSPSAPAPLGNGETEARSHRAPRGSAGAATCTPTPVPSLSPSPGTPRALCVAPLHAGSGRERKEQDPQHLRRRINKMEINPPAFAAKRSLRGVAFNNSNAAAERSPRHWVLINSAVM